MRIQGYLGPKWLYHLLMMGLLLLLLRNKKQVIGFSLVLS
jgi:hypothetical protein